MHTLPMSTYHLCMNLVSQEDSIAIVHHGTNFVESDMIFLKEGDRETPGPIK